MGGGVEITGTSVAAMVAADALTAAGVAVRLNAGNALLGRSFAPTRIDGRRLEFGARLLELSYDLDIHKEPRLNIRDYRGGDHRWWMPQIRDYMRGLVEPRPAQLFIDREHGPRCLDFLLTGDLRPLPSLLSYVERKAIEADAVAALREFPDGMPGAELSKMSYRSASLLLHGRAFTAMFIEPLLDKIIGEFEDVPAVDHRKVWLPLFRPSEILQGVWGESRRPRREMFFGTGELVERLAARVEPLRNKELPPGPVDRIVDAARLPGQTMRLSFVWSEATLDESSVTWHLHQRAFRSTIDGGIRCDEYGIDGAYPYTDAIASANVTVPLTSAPVDPLLGVIGSGSLNEQICQGLAAAAWRTR